MYDLTNSDTITLSYLVKERKEFGTIILVINEMDSLTAYQFELLLGDNSVGSFGVSGQSTYKYTFSSLPPGNYSVKVIEDANGNGRWDSGDYDKKLQPERITTFTIDELKANWDVEKTWEAKF